MDRKSIYLTIAAFGVIALGAIALIGRQIIISNQGRELPKPTASPTQAIVTIAPTDTVGKTITLEVTAPANKAVSTSARLTVKGKTAPGAEVMVNDVELKADSKGNFSTNLTLDEGENTIVIVANDADGNYAEKELTVTYEASNQ